MICESIFPSRFMSTMTRLLTGSSRPRLNLKDISRVLYPMYLQHGMNTIDSTKLIELADADYNMLKEKGKEGEKVLHYNGFLDGFARGLYEGSNPWHKASEELPEEDGIYIVMLGRNSFVCALEFDAISKQWSIAGYQSDVKYWMEIPELPKED